MENDWPPLENCIQYKCGMLPPYLQNFDWEHDEGDETESETEYTSDEDGNCVPSRTGSYKPSALRKFIKQVRESRGYDVDGTGVPLFMYNPFTRMDESDIRESEEWVNASIDVAINHINSKTGKVYKHVDTLKVVFALRHRTYLLTFTAKPTAEKEKKELVEEEEEKKKGVEADDDAETFLAAVFTPGHSTKDFTLDECFLKPQGPAPWRYEDPVFCD